ncbi:hypothetical protein AMATHDRAFT_63325 [Amanita thiersii Skay4041]|uniref:RNase III domain-containing protein n=1 Tax=Amanita thiersii Skay4041 TaxID=703135 RepID=A0A2A9NFI2_9AGAR|nr:hypothetical protein AMATHDRAFT_63325 [Amanita thiersii Skay4041]
MSRQWCNLGATLRSIQRLPKGAGLAPPRTAIGARRYTSSVLKTRLGAETRENSHRQPIRRHENLADDVDDFDSPGMASLSSGANSTTSGQGTPDGVSNVTRTQHSSDTSFVEHLNGLFPPLQFPPELARRILTHGSHPAAVHGHNAGLRFMGRRVIESYLLLFLNSSSALKPTHDLDVIVSRTLNTYLLGEHVGSSWGLGRALRWTPTLPAQQLKAMRDPQKLLRGVGLYKVQGDTVTAVLGGIYYHFGALAAQRVFHTRILPKLLLGRKPEGLPEVFHKDALDLCERMGGVDGEVLPSAPPQRAEALGN